MDTINEHIKIISLCTGIGGLERGLKRTGLPIRTICYVEIEAFICENLVKGMEAGIVDEAPIWTNLKTFDAQPFRGKVHGIIGGYPCQPFSNAGQRKGTDDPRHLYPYISGIIEATRPVFCFFENVEGHLTMGYDTVYQDLRRMGYKVEGGIYSAEEVGAPQQRNRLFILAILGNAKYNGQSPASFLRSCIKAGENNTQGQNIAIEPTGTNRPIDEPSLSGREMGNASSEGLSQSRQRGIRELSEETGTGIYNRLEQSSENELANSSNSGLQGSQQQGTFIERIGQSQSFRSITKCSSDKWPARPGQEQYDWEEPRTQPRVGSTIDGYNFREDFLRALGNSVVEQTAEIAFINLLNKHLNEE